MKIIGNLRKAIEENGFITIDQFINEAMYNIHEGYYINYDPIGKDSDFITSPEVSQLFGEMIGIYCADLWIKMNRPSKFYLVELGPGHATLMDDFLRATKNIKGFHEACQINFVEKNTRLIKIQKDKLSKYNMPKTWYKSIYDLPNNLPIIMFANEFFDCLPINQYIKIKDIWHEQTVSLNDTEFSLSYMPISPQLNESFCLEYIHAKDRAIIEICYPAIEIIQHITNLFQKTLGSLLFIDYGYDYKPKERTSFMSTLQAIKNHKYHPIFADIGRADLTAHVDFNVLRESALANNCLANETITQREFLTQLGITLRAEILKNNANPAEISVINSGLHRLIDPSQMGNLFKAMSIFSKDLQPYFFAKG